MPERLRVVTRGFTYPADSESLAIVRAAGGISKLSAEERARVRLKHVEVGDDCSDMPAESVAVRLARGEIARESYTGPIISEAIWADLGRPDDARDED